MLCGANFPQKFWAEALSTAVYSRNTSSTKALACCTPYEAWLDVKPVGYLKVFGCVAYAHIAIEKRQKLDYKAKKCILLGYGTDVRGYHLYSLQQKRVFFSRDVVFG